ncbi:MAG: Nramp family divalent metal transporter [Massiliimalia sp.]|jgi:manganese transport protein
MSKFTEKLKTIGPGALVAAGFIGPGTVTTCTTTGASFGYTLLWAMLFSTIATILFQEMSARLGVVTQKGLGENVRDLAKHPATRIFAVIIIISAIFIGNVAYEAGNLSGGSMGLSTLLPDTVSDSTIKTFMSISALVLGGIAFVLLWKGHYKSIENILIGLVLLMSVVFITTAIFSRPHWDQVIKGLFVPTMPTTDDGWLSVVALIGTTVVPYNLFLHASSASERWKNKEDVKSARLDTIISIGLGGLISMAVIISAAASFYGQDVTISSGADMAKQLEPLLGTWAKWFFGIGLFAAGFTSTITAPLSAAFATTGILGKNRDMKSGQFRFVWIAVLGAGIIVSFLGKTNPVQLILFAQAANAVILPIIAIFLTIALNSKKLGEYKNSFLNNILSILVIAVTLIISYRSALLFVDQIKSLLG